MKKILYTIATAILAAACVEENYRIAEPNPVFDITLNGVSVLEGPAQEIEFEKTFYPYSVAQKKKQALPDL